MVKFGDYIPLFGLEHIIYICGLILLVFVLFSNKEWIIEHEFQTTLLILVISFVQQILLYGSYFFLLDFDLGESLPLHISRINSILGILYLTTKDKKIYNVLSYFSVFAWLSFIMPSRVYGITHPIGISFLLNHVFTLLLLYYGMIISGYQIEKKGKQAALFWLIVYTFLCLIVNPLVDGNYFYLKYKPIFPNLPNVYYIPLLILFSYILFNLVEQFYKYIYKRLIK